MTSDAPPWLNVALIVAYIGLFGTLLTIAFNGYAARRERHRELFAEALAAVLAYWECPYVVRRRRHDDAAAERVRISEQLRKIQDKIAFHQAWIRTESPKVAAAYDQLVVTTRMVMGSQIREAWEAAPITADDQMNISDVSRDGLDELHDKYLESVQRHLSLWPRVPRRMFSR